MTLPSPSPVEDPELRSDIEAALASTGRYGPRYEVVRQAVSGSRTNLLLLAQDAPGADPALLWCRATPRSIDEAFDQRFTLRREATVIRRLAERGVRVPEILGTAPSGRVLIQRYVDPEPGTGATPPHVRIARYAAALDAVHRLPAAGVLPEEEIAGDPTTADAVRRERDGWIEVAARVLRTAGDIDALERFGGIDDAAARLARVRSHLADSPVPELRSPLALLHGDAGRENFVVDRAGDVWLIDWELAHGGSPLEDYAWIELRGLEQDEAAWRREVVDRLRSQGTAGAYPYFRALIYFRSVIAISARIAAAPRHPFVPYLAQRFQENELLGWLSAGASGGTPVGTATASAGERFAAWRRWTEDIDAVIAAHRPDNAS
jgi:aminoglycoside phosphotransferase (APT) family kinase protein